MFGYPCILKIELYNFLIISMLFSSDEVVQDGIGRCHTLWLFCARLLSHSPACSPVFSILNEPRLSSHSVIFQTSHSWCCVLGPFHLLSLPQSGFPRLKAAVPAEALQEPHHPPISYREADERHQPGSSWVTQTGPMVLQPPLITPCQKLPFPILNLIRIPDLLPSIGKLFQIFILWYKYPSNFQIMGFHRWFKPISWSICLNLVCWFFDFFATAAQQLFVPRFLLLFLLNFLCGPHCSCTLISLFCLQQSAFLLVQFHLEDFRTLFLVITVILSLPSSVFPALTSWLYSDIF